MGPPFEPKIGDLVIIKGGGMAARTLRLEITGRWAGLTMAATSAGGAPTCLRMGPFSHKA